MRPRVEPGESAAVIGCGGVGLQLVAALRTGRRDPIVAVDLDAGKAPARGRARRDASFATSRSATTEAVSRRLTDDGVDYAFEVVGPAGDDAPRLGQHPARRHSGRRRARTGRSGVALPAIEFLSDKGIRGSYYGSGDAAPPTSPGSPSSRSPATSTWRAS